MHPLILILVILLYFGALITISLITGRNSDNASFFIGNRRSPWYLVAFGMIGASISGVTFISIPGEVGSTAFSYLQLVFGYFAGYLVIANVLMPLYYKLNLSSIYVYLSVYLINVKDHIKNPQLYPNAYLFLVIGTDSFTPVIPLLPRHGESCIPGRPAFISYSFQSGKFLPIINPVTHPITLPAVTYNAASSVANASPHPAKPAP